MVKNFPKLVKLTKPQTQGQRTPVKMNSRKTYTYTVLIEMHIHMPRYMLLKTKYKVSKAPSWGGWMGRHIICRETKVRIIAYFSYESYANYKTVKWQH